MPIYLITNPSDPVTFNTEDVARACAVTLVLGSGLFGVKDENGELVMPLFAFSGTARKVEEFFLYKFGQGIDALLADTEATAAVLDTIATGSIESRKDYDRALAAITNEDERRKFMADWDDKHRSSMNAITEKAHKFAAQLRNKKAVEIGTAKPTIFTD